MIKTLDILNGNINEVFNPDIYEYEVSVDSSVSTLIFSYDIDSDYNVTIYGNDELTDGENHVYFEVSDEESVVTYTFLVNKEVTNSVFSYKEEVQDDSYFYKHKEVIISIISLVIIVLLFILIFRKK